MYISALPKMMLWLRGPRVMPPKPQLVLMHQSRGPGTLRTLRLQFHPFSPQPMTFPRVACLPLSDRSLELGSVPLQCRLLV